MICADPNPAGPGIREEKLAVEFPEMTIAEHPVPRGSHGTVDLGDTFAALGDFTLVLTVQPSRLPEATSAILAIDGLGDGLVLTFDGAARLAARLGEATIATEPLTIRQWVDVALTFEQATGRLRLAWRPVTAAADWRSTETTGLKAPVVKALAVLTIAAAGPSSPLATFDGRIENPQFYPRALTADECAASRTSQAPLADPLFAFDFARETTTSTLVDTGPNGLTGRLVNHPARAMRSSRWSGHEMCWRHAPGEYAAIHFHSDDMTDCGWPTALDWQVPADL